MKRPGSLSNRTKGLARSGELKRSGGPKRRLPEPDDPMEIARQEIRRAVFLRDGHCRLQGSCWGRCVGKRLTPHHLWKEGQGGPFTMRNLLTLCGGHNDGIETLPRLDMEAAGLVVPRGTTVTEAWRRLILAGIVPYWWDGTVSYLPSPDCVRSTTRVDYELALSYGLGPNHRAG